MCFDEAKLIADVRIMLAGVCEYKLPSDVIVHIGNCYCHNPAYKDNYPLIFFNTTLACIDWLIRKEIISNSGKVVGSERA